MLFDLEVDEETDLFGGKRTFQRLSRGDREVLKELVQPRDSLLQQISSLVQAHRGMLHSVPADEDHKCVCHARCRVLGKILRDQGHTVHIVSTRNPMCPMRNYSSTAVFENMNHVSLRVIDKNSAWIIVEWDFKDYFMVRKPSNRYREVFEEISDVFVGSSQQLRNVLKFLCKELQMSFAESGQELPPWRRLGSMMSRWLPTSPQLELLGTGASIAPIIPTVPVLEKLDQCCTEKGNVRGSICKDQFSPKHRDGAHLSLRSSLSQALEASTEPRRQGFEWLTSPIFVVGKNGTIRAAG